MPKRLPSLCGSRFGLLLVKAELEPIAKSGYRKARVYLCQCDCGASKPIRQDDLRSGRTVSCGCFKRSITKARHITHGDTASAEYTAWANMRARCHNPKSSYYYCYGGRGIKVCERWNSYEQFLQDMGRKPSSAHSLDRIDVDGDYGPGNCRWATVKEQASNKRSTVRFIYDGRSWTLAEVARSTGISIHTIYSRYYLLGLRGGELFTPLGAARRAHVQ
jgi:hypothetical protein